MGNKTFQNLDLESWKLLLNFDLSLIWEILEFGTKVLSPIFEQELEFFHSVWFLIKNTEARRAEEVKAFELAFMKVSYNRNAILPMFMSNGMPINGRHSWTLNDALMKRIACATRLINFLPQSFLDLNFAPRLLPKLFPSPFKECQEFFFRKRDSLGIRNDIRKWNQQHQRSIGLWPSKAESFGFRWPCRITGNTRLLKRSLS